MQEFQSQERQAKLRRLLRAYALRCPAVGYCQGLNYIAPPRLMYPYADYEVSTWHSRRGNVQKPPPSADRMHTTYRGEVLPPPAAARR